MALPPSSGTGTGTGSASVDLGRVVVVTLFGLSTLSAIGRGWLLVERQELSVATWLELASTLLTVMFCILVVRAYLQRQPARATDRGLTVRMIAPVATCLPFVLPALPDRPGGTGRSLLALALIVAGTAWSVWAVRHLSTCLSVVPQARALVSDGPYRWVRHPLYLGEIVAVAGFAVRGGHVGQAGVLVALIGLQLVRAVREERLLAERVPGYREYAARTWRIVPGVL
jgi:protein-S-isoprenylcysteine O-methyltransferase Ste14